ncbi:MULTISPECIES: hypothetical protein [Priestia]|uniref:hypothetical protein n=1 Tax=Priestia TaxID=2800373 RepID=UPI001454FA77|nr:hypothetical protein [Priestia aryabhattai]MBY0004060.1 hypothetical protein [Priestia aryabhattai]MBY0046655.1 hypothetical protein [Priestia aryabhattai]MED4389649.1 hypothetical protein [Priestia aryabhattai]NLR44727.1 hypothetical protein [Priestia megaterium]
MNHYTKRTSIKPLNLILFLHKPSIEMDKKEISKLASTVEATYMKDEEDIDFVPKDVEFLGGEDLSTVLVYRYANSKEKKKEVSVAVDYGDDYRVISYGYN